MGGPLSFGIDGLYQYDLSTPYDVTTASYSGNSFDVATLTGRTSFTARSLSLSNDDSKLYITEFSNHSIYEFNL
jgi:hypothetical protein